nr:MAG TPA: hypothetical protein [Caudoviricetes sp.]
MEQSPSARGFYFSRIFHKIITQFSQRYVII